MISVCCQRPRLFDNLRVVGSTRQRGLHELQAAKRRSGPPQGLQQYSLETDRIISSVMVVAPDTAWRASPESRSPPRQLVSGIAQSLDATSRTVYPHRVRVGARALAITLMFV